MARPPLTTVLVSLACVPLCVLAQPPSAPPAHAALSGLVESALDQPVSSRIEITERPIRDALRALEGPTGLRFVLDDQAAEWMPYGAQTRVSITLEGVSVRAGLARIFDGLGLAMRVVDDRVRVEPSAVLQRLGRRLRVDEVDLLQALTAAPWTAVDRRSFDVALHVGGDGDPADVLERALRASSAPHALAQLEAETQRLGWLWVPSGKTVVVLGPSEQIEQRLDMPIDVNFRRVPLDEVLVDLGRRIGVTIRFEPGVLARVAARERNIDLIQRGTTVRQVLELIGGNTGLTYGVADGTVMLRAGDGPATDGAAPTTMPASDGGRVVAILRVPVGADGTTIDFLIRADELPPEFRALRERKLPEVIEILRRGR